MRPMNLVLAGLLLCGVGAALVFGNLAEVPLWFVWTVGPMLWYVGFALTCAGLIKRVWAAAVAEKPKVHVTVLRFETNRNNAPSGLQHEVPPMGGFLL